MSPLGGELAGLRSGIQDDAAGDSLANASYLAPLAPRERGGQTRSASPQVNHLDVGVIGGVEDKLFGGDPLFLPDVAHDPGVDILVFLYDAERRQLMGGGGDNFYSLVGGLRVLGDEVYLPVAAGGRLQQVVVETLPVDVPDV